MKIGRGNYQIILNALTKKTYRIIGLAIIGNGLRKLVKKDSPELNERSLNAMDSRKDFFCSIVMFDSTDDGSVAAGGVAVVSEPL